MISSSSQHHSSRGPSSISASKSTNNPNIKIQLSNKWCHVLAKFALGFFGVALWYKGLSYYSYALLMLAWILDKDFHRSKETFKEPFVWAIIFFCLVLAAGVAWSDYPDTGYIRWNKYFTFLFIIPYLSLLNKDRLPWAIGGLVAGYSCVLLAGVYYWIVWEEQGIPLLKMTYLRFSLTVGIGVILALYVAGMSSRNKIKVLFWFLAGLLLFIQFNQDGRGPLLTTVMTSILLMFMLYKTKIKMLFGITASLIIIILAFSLNNDRFQQRLASAKSDIKFLQQEKFDTDLGYRLAIWDVGLYAISQRPLFGYGTGMALSTYEKYVETYKDGRYENLWRDPRFHYHNDLVEIGVFTGGLGISAFVFLLWGWFQSLKARRLTTLGTVVVCYVFLAGLTDIFLAYTGLPLLVIAVTALAIGWQKENDVLLQESE